MDNNDWTTVGDLVRRRRWALRLSQKEAADLAGISETTWGNLENARGESYAHATLVRICGAMQWTDDSIERIRAGGDPVVLPDTDAAPDGHGGSEGWPVYLEEKFNYAIAVAERALAVATEVREELRRLQEPEPPAKRPARRPRR